MSHRGHSWEKEAKDENIYVEVELHGEAVNIKNESQEEFIAVKEEIEEVPQEVDVKVSHDVRTTYCNSYSQLDVVLS